MMKMRRSTNCSGAHNVAPDKPVNATLSGAARRLTGASCFAIDGHATRSAA